MSIKRARRTKRLAKRRVMVCPLNMPASIPPSIEPNRMPAPIESTRGASMAPLFQWARAEEAPVKIMIDKDVPMHKCIRFGNSKPAA